MAFVYLDGHRMKIGTDKGATIYTLYLVIALSIEGKKSLLYAGIEERQERASTWAHILKLLVGRGLKKPPMFITDDLSPTIRYVCSTFSGLSGGICSERRLKI